MVQVRNRAGQEAKEFGDVYDIIPKEDRFWDRLRSDDLTPGARSDYLTPGARSEAVIPGNENTT